MAMGLVMEKVHSRSNNCTPASRHLCNHRNLGHRNFSPKNMKGNNNGIQQSHHPCNHRNPEAHIA